MNDTTSHKILEKQFRGKRTLLNYYLAGFVDGEASFSVAIIKHPTQKFRWMINPCFQVYQHKNHPEILELCRFIFGTGSIYAKAGTPNVLVFSIDSRRNLIEKVLPFFDQYPLITKQDTYKVFREIVISMEKREHWTVPGFKRLVTLAFTMNQQGKGRKHTLESIFASLPNALQKSSETTR
jgi:hypothetical protein